MLENRDAILRCLTLVVERSGLGDWRNWTKRDYEQLGRLIEAKTKIALSTSTLVRIFKQRFNNRPQKITLDTLAQFIGYENWHSFIMENTVDPAKVIQTGKPRGEWLRYAVLLTGSVILVFFAYMGISALFSDRSFDPADIEFRILNPEMTGVPATIQVEYGVGKHKPDSLWLQLYWNPEEIIRLDPGQNRISAIYCYPGVHHCKLIADHQVVGEQRIVINTYGWTALIRHTGLQMVPLYIRNRDIIHAGIMQVTESMVNLQNLQPNKDIFTSYYYVNDLGLIYSDDYRISGTVRNPPVTLGTQPCGYCSVYVICENGKHFFTIGDRGCSGMFKYGFSGKDFMDKFPDLSSFETNISEWTTFESVVQGNTVNIYVNSKLIHASGEVNDLGKILGLHFVFSGLGALDRVKLSNSINFTALDEDFNSPEKMESIH